MDAARFNVFWFLWLLLPIAIMFLATMNHRRLRGMVGAAICMVATYFLSNLAVQEKWNIRLAIAATPEERDDAIADGANLVFNLLFFAPVESVFFTLFWGVVGWRFWSWLRNSSTGST